MRLCTKNRNMGQAVMVKTARIGSVNVSEWLGRPGNFAIQEMKLIKGAEA